MKKPLCPILLIGFPAPEEHEKEDIRECTEECAWFDKERDCCTIKAIKEVIEETAAAMFDFEPDPYLDVDEYYVTKGETN